MKDYSKNQSSTQTDQPAGGSSSTGSKGGQSSYGSQDSDDAKTDMNQKGQSTTTDQSQSASGYKGGQASYDSAEEEPVEDDDVAL